MIAVSQSPGASVTLVVAGVCMGLGLRTWTSTLQATFDLRSSKDGDLTLAGRTYRGLPARQVRSLACTHQRLFQWT